MIEDALWQREEDFWVGPAAVAAAMLDPGCLMAFPDPAGLLCGAAVIAPTLEKAPRWSRVLMTDRCLAAAAPDLAVLAYRVEAHRGAEAAWRALCTSTWRRTAEGWWLVQHQQTPS